MWSYRQTTGEITHSGDVVGTAYSGHGAGLNNPDEQFVMGTGPIPQGSYRIGPAFTHPTAGPLAMRLEPLPGTETRGRAGFLIHGDNSAMNHTASEGCIIAARWIRALVMTAVERGDDELVVIA